MKYKSEVVRRGWRYFQCPECDHRWKLPSRDVFSPSGESCPRCDEWCQPYNGELDATIPCDNMGNLLKPPCNLTNQAFIRECDTCKTVTAIDLDPTLEHLKEMHYWGQTIRTVSHDEAMQLWKTSRRCNCAPN